MPRRDLRPLNRGDYFTDGLVLVEVAAVTGKGDVEAVDVVSGAVTRLTVQNFRACFRRVVPEAA